MNLPNPTGEIVRSFMGISKREPMRLADSDTHEAPPRRSRNSGKFVILLGVLYRRNDNDGLLFLVAYVINMSQEFRKGWLGLKSGLEKSYSKLQ